MKTVGDFKANGWAIVNGDQVRGCDGFVGKVMCCKTFNETIQFDKEVIVEFAWRTNTGVKPEFVGEVELMDGNHNTGVKHSSKVNWEKHPQAGDASICQWRPHLPAAIQTETPEEKEAFEAMNKSPYDVGAHVSDASKPAYTQAMCDAGELPPVGARCLAVARAGLTAGLHSWTPVTVMYLSASTIVAANDCGDEYVFNLATGQDVMFKPIKTELENAIDEMVATAVNSTDDIAKSIIYEACVKLAEAGYVKPSYSNSK